MKTLLILVTAFILAGCAGVVDVGKRDFAISLTELDAMTGFPGAGTVQADGCLLIVRNAQILKDTGVSLAEVVKAMKLQTPKCNAGAGSIGDPNAVVR